MLTWMMLESNMWTLLWRQYKNVYMGCLVLKYRDMPKGFGHCNFLLYISYKTTIFENIIPVNSFSILMNFLPTEARTYVVFCDYFKIFFGSTDFKCSWFKHKLKLFVFKYTIIVLYFWRSKFSFVFKSWTHKNYRL
jgi:hypothetical protein